MAFPSVCVPPTPEPASVKTGNVFDLQKISKTSLDIKFLDEIIFSPKINMGQKQSESFIAGPQNVVIYGQENK